MIEQLIKVKDSYNCDALSIAAATAAIDDQAWLAENRRKIVATRARLTGGTARAGLRRSIPSQANFVWCTHPDSTPPRPLYEQLKAAHILVRYMNYPGWGDGLRISVGTRRAESTRCLATLDSLTDHCRVAWRLGKRGASTAAKCARTMNMPRTATIDRKTARNRDPTWSSNLDGSGQGSIATGVGFFDHMLTLLARHAAFDLTVEAKGDLHVDQHHTVEDVGICLGQAMQAGPRRQGGHPPLRPLHAADGRDAGHDGDRPVAAATSWCSSAEFPAPKIGDFDSELVEDFWQAVAANALCNLHVLLHYGRNSHHISEAIFKAARALRMASNRPAMPACRARRDAGRVAASDRARRQLM